jgi:hypothetical protein
MVIGIRNIEVGSIGSDSMRIIKLVVATPGTPDLGDITQVAA